jgi:hypothetical protein
LDSVPICSSPCDVSEKPPSPTQNAENDAGVALQLATGTTHEPETLEYEAGAAGSADETAYPAQFELVDVAALATAGTTNATATVARSASRFGIRHTRPYAVKTALRKEENPRWTRVLLSTTRSR